MYDLKYCIISKLKLRGDEKMKKTKLISILLVLAMIASVFVSCASDSEKDRDSFEEDKENKPSVTDTNESEVPTADNKATTSPVATANPEAEEHGKEPQPDIEPDPTPNFDLDLDLDFDLNPDLDVGENSDFITIYDGYGKKSLPYEKQGITIKEFDVTDDYITATITNNSNITIEEISSFSLKIYYDGAAESEETSLYTEELEPGESSKVIKYIAGTPTEILAGDVNIYEKESFKEANTYFCNDTTFNAFEYAGLFFEKHPLKDDKIKITNNTGMAIKSVSFGYKNYDTNGFVVDSNEIWVNDLNDGESTSVYFFNDADTGKFVFGDVSYVEGESLIIDSLSENNGLITNTLPYSENGIVINSVTYDGEIAYVNITNQTEKEIEGILYYKAYDSMNEVLESSLEFFELGNEESTVLDIYLYEEDVEKLILGNVVISN